MPQGGHPPHHSITVSASCWLQRHVEAFRARTKDFDVLFASKAFPCTAVYRVLAEEGHLYSSSLYPVRHDLYGTPDAPRHAFRPGSKTRTRSTSPRPVKEPALVRLALR